MASDAQLVGRVADGDEAALRVLLQRYERPLSHFLYRQTSGRDVDDLYQEVWMRVVRHANRFDPTRRFTTWLFQIAVNLCRDWHRRQVPLAEPADVEGMASTDLSRSDAALDAGKLLAALPEAQREVVILRFFHDLTEDEVARILECPKGTVKSRLHNALARLAAMVGQEAR